MAETTTSIPGFVDDAHAPEIFASFLAGAAFDGPNVHLTFASSRVDHSVAPGSIKHVANARLVMSIPAAQNMCSLLTQLLQAANLNALQKPEGQDLQ
jgi:hypothetical protein